MTSVRGSWDQNGILKISVLLYAMKFVAEQKADCNLWRLHKLKLLRQRIKFWNIASLKKTLKKNIKLITADNTKDKVERKAVEALENLAEWSKNVKLKFCSEKSQLMYLPSSITSNRKVFIRLHNQCIKKADLIKYLGIIIDWKLNWTEHATNLRNKVLKDSNRLSSICRTDWSLDPKILKRIYTSGLERIALLPYRATKIL